ncbi:rod shape-determining protein MreC [Sphingomonas sp. FW199]|uniref:rod shape-determining protein MreC n=1 Tax=unclassified Sphingomonas TaxID=196159 RepID=UPI0021A962A6|nr:rod shape-determining protein MreC [Sphingomonas sp. BGYR3]MDG5487382.1 rod shape-determining protein MreC [Sphingomonas sp. BGYR3]
MAPPKNRPGFSKRAQYSLFIGYVIAVSGVVIGAAALLLSILDPQAFGVLRGTVREVTTPFATGTHWTRRQLSAIPEGIGAYFGAVSENRRLKRELADNRLLLQRARALTVENQRLRAIAQLRERAIEPVIAARLVASSASSTRRYAILNAGSMQGVNRAQPVRGPEGLIGRVIETGPNSARVLLIVDPDSVVPAQRTRDGMPAIINGRGDGMVDIRVANVSNAPLKAGDSFITSGAGGIYPPGIPVARVLASGRDAVIGRPFANPDALDFALVQRAYVPELARPDETPPENAGAAE